MAVYPRASRLAGGEGREEILQPDDGYSRKEPRGSRCFLSPVTTNSALVAKAHSRVLLFLRPASVTLTNSDGSCTPPATHRVCAAARLVLSFSHPNSRILAPCSSCGSTAPKQYVCNVEGVSDVPGRVDRPCRVVGPWLSRPREVDGPLEVLGQTGPSSSSPRCRSTCSI